MNKSLALLALGALLVLPAASAQLPAHSLAVSIDGLPATSTINGTLMALPFTVQASVTGNSPCLATGGSTYTFTLTAEVVNSTGNSTTVQVSPATFTVSGPSTLPGAVSRTSAGTLLVNPGPYVGQNLTAEIRLTAASAGGNPGCTGVSGTAAVETTADVTAVFLPAEGYGTPATDGQEMPALPVAFLLVALAALVAARRQA